MPAKAKTKTKTRSGKKTASQRIPPSKLNKSLHTISFLVANKPGVLVRVALVFSRRGFNIDSLVVSPAHDPRFSRMTITAQGDPATLDQIIKQSGKLIDVIHVEEHTRDDTVQVETALLKVRVKPQSKASLSKTIKRFKATVLDETDDALIVEHTGSTEELDELEFLLAKHGIIEMIRSGKMIMACGKEPT